jgi:hypothetical protein
MRSNVILLIKILIFVILLVSLNGSSILNNQMKKELFSEKILSQNILLNDNYIGYLRIYIVEPSSRWINFDREPIYFGFLDFAFYDELSIPYLDTYNFSIIWNGTKAGYNTIRENNIFVIAAITNSEINKGYSYPPSGYPFNANYIDASAGAKPGDICYNIVNEDFTHSVFIEEGTSTLSSFCPPMTEALYNIYGSGDYPFYFVNLIADKNQVAEDRLINDYNIYGYPTAYFDGGAKLIVGGFDDETYYRKRITQCGERDVHELNLSLNVEWIKDGEIEININIINNEKSSNSPPLAPTIDGPNYGRRGREYEYAFSSLDPDGDDVYYWILWFEGCHGISWDGPYNSGEIVKKSYTYNEEGDYIISVKAKDTYGAESEWSTIEVSMPKTKSINDFSPWISRLIERFPILELLL